MPLKLEHKGLWQGTERGHGPGHYQHNLGPPGVGQVGDGEHYGRESVKRDDNHDETREVNANNPIEDHDPTGNIISHPRYCDTPSNL